MGRRKQRLNQILDPVCICNLQIERTTVEQLEKLAEEYRWPVKQVIRELLKDALALRARLREVKKPRKHRPPTAVNALLRAAALTVLHFRRKRDSGNFQDDDEHEAWTALETAIRKVRQERRETAE